MVINNRKIIALIISLILPACSSSTPMKKVAPGWVMNPPGNQVTDCVPATNHNILTLKEIATIKAKARYLAQNETHIRYTSTLIKTTRVNDEKTNTNVKLVEKTRQETSGVLDHYPEVKQAEMVDLNKQRYYCVRYGI